MELLTDDLICYLSKFLIGKYRQQWWVCRPGHWQVLLQTRTQARTIGEEIFGVTKLHNLRSLVYSDVYGSQCQSNFNTFTGIRRLDLRAAVFTYQLSLPYLETLSTNLEITPERLGNCPSLTALKCGGVNFEVIPMLTQLCKLKLMFFHSSNRVTDFSNFSRLTYLSYMSWILTPREIILPNSLLRLITDVNPSLLSLTNLTELKFKFQGPVDIDHLIRLTSLKANCPHKINISQLPQLREYRNRGCLFRWPHLTNIHTLQVNSLTPECFALTNLTTLKVVLFYPVITQLNSLVDLTVKQTIPDKHLSTLTSLTRLRIRDGAASYPLSLRSLRVIDWAVNGEFCRISSLQNLSNLTDLTIHSHDIVLLPEISRLTQLRRLDIRYNGDITKCSGDSSDYCSRNIGGLTNLTALDVFLPFKDVEWLTALRLLDKLTITCERILVELPLWLQRIVQMYALE